MTPVKFPPPRLFYPFLVLGVAAWLIAFIDTVKDIRGFSGEAVPAALLVLVGYSLLSLPFRLGHIAILTLLAWMAFASLMSIVFAGSALVASDISSSSRIWRSIFAVSQLGASVLFFRQPLLFWLASGGYLKNGHGSIDGEPDLPDSETAEEEDVLPSLGR